MLDVVALLLCCGANGKEFVSEPKNEVHLFYAVEDVGVLEEAVGVLFSAFCVGNFRTTGKSVWIS